MTKTLIIAEAGVNHNGDINTALKLVDAAKDAGADIIKFQTFKAASLASKNAPKADYQKENTDSAESQYEMLKKLELTNDAHQKLIEYCNNVDIEFLSTPFDIDSLNLLKDKVKKIKLGSGELTNAPLLLAAAESGRPIILSTGMSTFDEIKEALGVFAFGYTNSENAMPTRSDFIKSWNSDDGKELVRKNITLLHCTTQYPTPFEDVNLNAMSSMRDEFKVDVGYSDHTSGISVSIAAVALGATIIEKHFTLDKTMSGPDHKASLEPNELKQMVKAIIDVENSMGDGIKVPSSSEKKNILIARKSLVASKNIKNGEKFTKKNITVKRPGTGINPMEYWDYIGKTSPKDFTEDEVIEK